MSMLFKDGRIAKRNSAIARVPPPYQYPNRDGQGVRSADWKLDKKLESYKVKYLFKKIVRTYSQIDPEAELDKRLADYMILEDKEYLSKFSRFLGLYREIIHERPAHTLMLGSILEGKDLSSSAVIQLLQSEKISATLILFPKSIASVLLTKFYDLATNNGKTYKTILESPQIVTEQIFAFCDKLASPEYVKMLNDPRVAKWAGTPGPWVEDPEQYLASLRLVHCAPVLFPESADFELVTSSHNNIMALLKEGLEDLVTDDQSAVAVLLYVLSRGKLPKPDQSNLDSYFEMAKKHIASVYGISKELSDAHLPMLMGLNDSDLGAAANLINIAQEKNPKFYSINTLSLIQPKLGKRDLVKYCIEAIISRNEELAREAKNNIVEIVGPKAINRARNDFFKNKDLVKRVRNTIHSNNNYDHVQIYDLLLLSESDAIADVLGAAMYKDIQLPFNSNLLKAVESKNPLDYNGSIQMTCTYLPRGTKSQDILGYCAEPNIVMIRYDVGGTAIGSAICYAKDGLFVVDSVEGHRAFRKEKFYEITYNDLAIRAAEMGCHSIIFGRNGVNLTSTEFIAYVKQVKRLPIRKIKMDYNPVAYLESKPGTYGYFLELSKKPELKMEIRA